MPPAPIITTYINNELFLLACKRLDIAPPLVKFVRMKDRRTWGEYNPLSKSITIYANLPYQLDKLTTATRQVSETLLHELRHAWQFKTWSLAQWKKEEATPYHLKPSEKDANDWAAANLVEFSTIARIKRVYPSSGMAKLALHERRQKV